MHDLFDAGAGGGDLFAENSQSTRPIADHSAEPTETTVGDQAAFDYAAENIWVNIAAAKGKNDAFAGKLRQFSRENCGQRRGPGTFHNCFFQFNQPQNCYRNL